MSAVIVTVGESLWATSRFWWCGGEGPVQGWDRKTLYGKTLAGMEAWRTRAVIAAARTELIARTYELPEASLFEGLSRLTEQEHAERMGEYRGALELAWSDDHHHLLPAELDTLWRMTRKPAGEGLDDWLPVEPSRCLLLHSPSNVGTARALRALMGNLYLGVEVTIKEVQAWNPEETVRGQGDDLKKTLGGFLGESQDPPRFVLSGGFKAAGVQVALAAMAKLRSIKAYHAYDSGTRGLMLSDGAVSRFAPIPPPPTELG